MNKTHLQIEADIVDDVVGQAVRLDPVQSAASVHDGITNPTCIASEELVIFEPVNKVLAHIFRVLRFEVQQQLPRLPKRRFVVRLKPRQKILCARYIVSHAMLDFTSARDILNIKWNHFETPLDL